MSRADAGRVGAARHVLRRSSAETAQRAPRCSCSRATATARASSSRNRFALGEGLVGQCALEKKTIIVDDVPDDYVADRARASATRRRATSSVLPGAVRGAGRGRDRARLVPAVQPDPPHVPRAADAVDRRRVQHDQRQHAHRGAARGAQGLERRAREAHATSSRRRRSLLEVKNREIARGQRLARREGASSSRWSPSTSPSSSRTCRTSCARRSTAC